MPDPIRCLAAISLALLCGSVLCSCAAYETARVVVLDDVPAEEAIRRTGDHDAEPLFVDTTGAIVAKRQLRTAI